MTKWISTHPTFMQWFSVAILSADAGLNIWLDQLYLLAANTFFLGSVALSIGLRHHYVARMTELDILVERATLSRQLADVAAQKFGEAVHAGRIEVIAIQPDDNHNTMH